MIPDKSGMLFKVNVHNEAAVCNWENPTARLLECVESAKLYELSSKFIRSINEKNNVNALFGLIC